MQAPRVPVPATGSSCEPSVPPAIGSSDSSWVVEMENMINSTEKPQQRARHSIYRVPEYIKDRTKRDAYRPKLVSLGPFHHGDPVLLPMEAHKRRAVVQLVKRSGKPLREFIAAVEKIYDQLHEAYENLDKAWHPKRFVELMVIDGCFFLEVMRMFSLRGKVEKDYGSDDPIFSEHGYLYLKDNIISDVLLIENQLPSLLLQNLMFLTVDPKTFQVNNQVHTFLDDILTPASPINNHLGLHPLDILHKSVCGERGYYRKSTLESEMHPASVLHEAGIHFKVSEAHGFAGAVSFESSVLRIPRISFFDETESVLLNLMAFEQLHPGAGNDVTAFVYFLDILIDTPKDVTLLRSKGIIENGFGSDEEVANLINKTLSKGAVKSPNSNINNVLEDMTMHCKKMWNKWRATFIHTYFINPWVFSSLIAAFILLFATVTQTIYTGTSFYQKK
ncbi:hypothetical protein GUJ93_ZPchr0011g27152 [Zizania palustris]|uniref:Uncharacterized protein n=1 Tax=Zizania palustris TaxID=103762 RepID=A0A8J5WK89_ZIZPA|nr:hypothetical protein GUJ93_ZPchr0011g27152 [Zizania palustris]